MDTWRIFLHENFEVAIEATHPLLKLVDPASKFFFNLLLTGKYVIHVIQKETFFSASVKIIRKRVTNYLLMLISVRVLIIFLLKKCCKELYLTDTSS